MKKLTLTPPLLEVITYPKFDIIYSSYDDDDFDNTGEYIDSEDDVW